MFKRPFRIARNLLEKRVRWKKTFLAALSTLWMAPMAPAFADATAYARVRRDGSLDTANAKGVLRVTRVSLGTYCFRLATTARVGMASASARENRPISSTVFTPADGAARLSGCPTDSPYAVITFLPNGARFDSEFYVVFF